MPQKDNYIPLDQCIHRMIYKLGSRNLSLGVFDQASKSFFGIREKFDDIYLFNEYHWDNGPPFGTACPYEEVGLLPDNIEVKSNVDTFDQKTKRLVAFNKEKGDEDRPKGWYYIDTGEYSREIRPTTATYKPLFDYLKPLDKRFANWKPPEEIDGD
jgi:hypothetical protein